MKLPALKEIIEERKTRAIDTLSGRFAQNALPLEEYERLVEYIHKIESERELIVVEKIVAEFGGGTEERGPSSRESSGDGMPGDHSSLTANFAILSSRTFSGPRRMGELFVSILGSGHIKIRKGDLLQGRICLDLISILGDTVVFVEPGIRVKNRVLPILGDARVDGKVEKQAQSGAPELIVSGAALLGNITVKVLKD